MRYHLPVMSEAKYERILIATTNLGKAAEIAALLAGCANNFSGLDEFPGIEEPVEDGETFAGNARIKSLYYSRQTGMVTVADDSGLMVDVLGGAPGVHSARLVEQGAGDAARNRKLLHMLADTKDPDERTAQFICAACFIDQDEGIEIIEEGILCGRIAFEPEGEEGFGFDPVFIPDGYDTTVAALGIETKNRISHRRMAFEKLAMSIRDIK
jgi:XTP/dITP diphosphohydrolase